MPARKGTKGYYLARIENGTITADELDEYSKLLDADVAKMEAQKKEISEARRTAKKARKDLARRQAQDYARKLGQSVIDKFGEDVEVSELALAGESDKDYESLERYAQRLTEVAIEMLGRLDATPTSGGRSTLEYFEKQWGDDTIPTMIELTGYSSAAEESGN